jgi:hypothetical protein
MKTKLRELAWRLADVLSWLACKLRGNAWYRADNMAAVSGNRAAELRQTIWERVVVMKPQSETDQEWLNAIDRELTELGQIAGENWGHWKGL